MSELKLQSVRIDGYRGSFLMYDAESVDAKLTAKDTEITELKKLMKEATTKMGFVSAWLGHPHDKTLADMRDKLREAVK